MFNALKRLAVLGLVSGMGWAALAAPEKSPALSKQRYDLILANLDAGGDLLVVANMEGWIRDAVQSLVKPITLMGGNDPEFKSVIECLGKLPGFLDKNGFYGLQGFGMSLVPRTDGLNDLKCFVARDPAVTWTPLWLAMVGGKPRTLTCTDFLPADTELAQTGTGECGALWKMVRSGVAELGTPAVAVSFNSQISALATNWGVNLDKVFESMAGEGFFSIQFSRTKTMALPGAGAPVSMPEPAFLMGTAVKDSTVVEALEAAIKKSGMLSVTNWGDGIKVIKLPLPIPFPFQPAYAVHQGFFLFGSTPDGVAAGIKAFQGKTGLVATPEFKKAFKGLPTVNNGLAYMSPRFMNTVMEVQKAVISRDPAQGVKMAGLMDEMMGCKKDMSVSKVFLNKRDGVAVEGISSAGAKEMAASVMIAPVGLLAGIAIPSFMKARSTSQSNACINNLRMLEAAKEQWALENKKAMGDTVMAPGVLKYLGMGRMPICPQGGRYTLNVIGKNARCSIPAHQLRE